MYLAGGCDGAQTCAGGPLGSCTCTALADEMLAFDPVANAYAVLPPMPVARYRHDACALGDTIYYFGGRSLPADAIITQVDAFNTTSRTWATLPPEAAYPAGLAPGAPQLGSDNSCATLGGAIYMSGGYDLYYSVTFNWTWAFAPPAVAGGAWWTPRG